MTAAPELESIRNRYRETFGSVPHGIEDRLRVAHATGRLDVEETFATLRRLVLHESPLGTRTQQLVHVGQLLVLGRGGPARLHARGALQAGATLADLVGVAETALITGGAPAYALGIEIVAELFDAAEPPD
ncbi:carboxymuconolactone decarboxylase family protein [Nocardia stercoris]|uniref:Carboxymuconolactone decarboxylase family protein n=1 Tax=Nocardia stercoris TaxID=2483361 RepID=A0A3M2L1F1_9NOCA|nr:carboxymuconolactone decarboxylase family protein [Nocardia stercoris]RMI30560.1 carboxymuconolactone decarboxylase family protein [Nocardia stercoris]